jgi:hypothetical protein
VETTPRTEDPTAIAVSIVCIIIAPITVVATATTVEILPTIIDRIEEPTATTDDIRPTILWLTEDVTDTPSDRMAVRDPYKEDAMAVAEAVRAITLPNKEFVDATDVLTRPKHRPITNEAVATAEEILPVRLAIKESGDFTESDGNAVTLPNTSLPRATVRAGLTKISARIIIWSHTIWGLASTPSKPIWAAFTEFVVQSDPSTGLVSQMSSNQLVTSITGA